MLSSFKQSFPEIKKAIMDLDEVGLTTENVQALKQFTPQNEEVRFYRVARTRANFLLQMELLKEHVNNTANLAKAEQFFVEVFRL